MGTGIVANLLISIPFKSAFLYYASIVFFILNTGLFAMALAMSILRYALYPEIWGVMVRDPTNSLFLATCPMGFATLIEMWASVCVPLWGDWAATFVWALWIVDVVAAALATASLTFILLVVFPDVPKTFDFANAVQHVAKPYHIAGSNNRSTATTDGCYDRRSRRRSEDRRDPVRSVPCIGDDSNLIYPVGSWYSTGDVNPGYLLSAARGAQVAISRDYCELLLAAWSSGVWRLWVSISLLRCTAYRADSIRIMYLGKVSRNLLENNNVLDPMAGGIAYVLGVFISLLMWSFGLIWLVFALATIYYSSPFPFNMGWWGFTFPLGVYAANTMQLGIEMDVMFFKIFGTVCDYPEQLKVAGTDLGL